MNTRSPTPADENWLKTQDELLEGLIGKDHHRVQPPLEARHPYAGTIAHGSLTDLHPRTARQLPQQLPGPGEELQPVFDCPLLHRHGRIRLPAEGGAKIAVRTVRKWPDDTGSEMMATFDVSSNEDLAF